ncbi:hypothetical protein QR680_000440 [Steinernema hermaphroditum]|uniref:Uncharacterized protein n=1 Tax=Steinernema hermaphroditum TaxID=289476 RepID=A0AA39GWL2_9BILA|nr:hypothetical protein QR680_000440 [Steinernema hermaphroditum]
MKPQTRFISATPTPPAVYHNCSCPKYYPRKAASDDVSRQRAAECEWRRKSGAQSTASNNAYPAVIRQRNVGLYSGENRSLWNFLRLCLTPYRDILAERNPKAYELDVISSVLGHAR